MPHFFAVVHRITLAISVLLVFNHKAKSQSIDRSFTPPEITITDWQVNSVKSATQGYTLLGGRFDFVRGNRCGNLVRLQPDGAPDLTFNAGGIGTNGPITDLLALPNGQWLVAGSFNRYNQQPTGPVVRLNADGTPDVAFNITGLSAGRSVRQLVIDSQGRLLAIVSDANQPNSPRGQLVRFLPSGARDASFQPDTALAFAVGSLMIDRSDRILAARGQFGQFVHELGRLLSNGAVDPSFAPGLTGAIGPVRLLPNGQILVGSASSQSLSYGGTNLNTPLARLLPDGRPDTSFLFQQLNSVTALEVLPTGEVLAGGRRYLASTILRLLPNGNPDTSFVTPSDMSSIEGLSVAANGDVLIRGAFARLAHQPANGYARLTSQGARDAGFADSPLWSRGTITQLSQQSGGRLLVAGQFDRLNGRRARLSRLLPDGSVDSRFLPDTLLFEVKKVDAVDRLLTSDDLSVSRFLPDGQRDTTFQMGSLMGGCFGCYGQRAEGIGELPDGRLLVYGYFDTYNGWATGGVARVWPNGQVDTTFRVDVTAGNRVTACTPLPGGRLRVYFAAFYPGSLSGAWLIELDSTGAVSPAFHGGQAMAATGPVADLPNGDFLAYDNLTQAYHRYTVTGVPDSSFVYDATLRGQPVRLYPQPDGRLLVHSLPSWDYPLSMAGNQRPLRRLLPDGALDPSFQPVSFENGLLNGGYYALLTTSTGDIVIGGNFTSVNGDDHYPTLVRLHQPVAGVSADNTRAGFTVYPNPAHHNLTLRRASAEAAIATVIDVLGRPLRQWSLTEAEQTVSVGGLPSGAYVVRVVGTAGVLTCRIVVE